MRFFFLYLVIGLPMAWTQEAGVIGVQTEEVAKQIRLAEPFEVRYRIRLSEGVELDLSGWKPGVTQWAEFTLWDYKLRETRKQADLTVFLVPFALGQQEIPNLSLPLKQSYDEARAMTGNKSIRTVTTPAIPITVLDPTQGSKEPPKLRDIRAPRKPLYFWESPAGLTAIAFLILSAAGAFLLWRLRRLPKMQPESAGEAALPAEEIFWKGLANLDHAGYLEARRYREYYFGLSSLFRRYLEIRFGLDVESLTSQELARELSSKREELNLDSRLLAPLKESFEIMDLAKYARYTPDAAQQVRAVEALKNFVQGSLKIKS